MLLRGVKRRHCVMHWAALLTPAPLHVIAFTRFRPSATGKNLKLPSSEFRLTLLPFHSPARGASDDSSESARLFFAIKGGISDNNFIAHLDQIHSFLCLEID